MKAAESQIRGKLGLFTKISFFVLMIIGMLFPINPSEISKSLAAPLTGVTYYVDVTNGLDSNAGTETKPWKTIQKCLNQVQAGDTCEILGGAYSESLVLKTTGTQSSRITIRNYNNQTVTINSGSSRTLVTSGNIGYYTIDGFSFITTGSPSSSTDASVNFAYNFWGDGHTAEKGNDGFILRNCYIEGAIYFYGSDSLVENCELNGKSTWMNGLIERSQPSENNIFRQNIIHDYTQRGGWSMQFVDNSLWQNNLVYNNGEMGIDCDGAGYPVTRCNIKNNIIHDISGEGVGILLENAFNSVIEANEIYNTKQGIGIINYGTPISQVEYRTTDTNTIIRNNLIHDTSNDGIVCKGSPGGKALNNTIYNTLQSSGYWAAIGLSVYEGFYCHNWEIKNNLISQANKYAIWYDSSSSWLTNLSVDYNLYDFGASQAKIYWVERGTSTIYHTYTLAQFQSAKGLELHSVRGDPLFVNATNKDFLLQASSPAINHGADVNVSTDFVDNSRPQGTGFDIGAYEFVDQTQPTESFTSTPTNTILPTETFTPTPNNTSTSTPTATNSSTYTPTAKNTSTSTPTATNTPSYTSTAKNTSTSTPTAVNSPTNSPTVKNTSTSTPTAVNSPTNTPITCNSEEAGTNQLIGCIYNGTNFETLSGPAPSGNVITSTDGVTTTILDYNWGLSAPNAFIGEDDFSAKWKGNFTFIPGIYTFTVGSDDGIRIKINGITMVDAWRLQEFTTQMLTQSFSTLTTIPIEVEYFENAIEARVYIFWTYEPMTNDQSISLSWQAEDGIISNPFFVNNGYIYQSQTTDITNGGEARYPFNITVPGTYAIQAQVKAPSDANNSFFVNIDEQPTAPDMIWDVGITSEFERQLVCWRGNGTASQNQYNPKAFTLGVGNHELIIRGREAYTQLDSISLVLVDPIPTPTDTPRMYQIYLPIIISP